MLSESGFFLSAPDESELSVADWKAFSQSLTDATLDGVCVINQNT